MPRIAIVGGGISGLAAAYFLEKKRLAGVPLAYTLYEAGDRLGGVIQTETAGGYTIEAGPDSFLSSKSWARELCEELGLGDQLIYSRDHERKTYVLVNNKLVPIPDGMQFMVPTRASAVMTSPLFSVKTKLRFAEEWLRPQKVKGKINDESVEEFVTRHFGRELVDHLAEPMLAGVYGGDASTMSARAVLPGMVKMEEEHGSLVRAVLASKKRSPGGGSKTPLFTSLRPGMEALVRALAAKLPANSVRMNSRVQRISHDGQRWTLWANGQQEQFDQMILALPAYAAAALLEEASPAISGKLRSINYTSSIAVALGYKAEDAQRSGPALPGGFGLLVPRSAGKRMMACTFVHQKFEDRAQPGHLLLRVFFGGRRNQELIDAPDDELLRIARQELDEILGWKAGPEIVRAYRWSRVMAQYEVGHLELVSKIQRLLQQRPHLSLAGNAYQGIGIPDCIRSGEQAAMKALQPLPTSQPA